MTVLQLDALSTDLRANRVTRDGVLQDLDSVNDLAVRLNSEKLDLLQRVTDQNQQVSCEQMFTNPARL